MPKNLEIFKSFEEGKNLQPVRFQYNTPFSINPRFDERRINTEHSFYTSSQPKVIEVLLRGEDDNKGFVKLKQINNGAVLHIGETVQMPFGEALAKFRIDPTTGEMIPEQLPVSIAVGAGPATSQEIENSDIYVAMDLPSGGGRFISINHNYFFDNNGKRRMLTTAGWINSKDGSRGPLLLPSTADFDKINFTIVRR